MESRVEPPASIDEKHGIVDVVFLAKFLQEYLDDGGRTRRKQSNVEVSLRIGIDRGVQPLPFIVEVNHRFLECDVIRAGSRCWLEIGFLHPRVNGRSTPFDTEPLENQKGIRQ